MIKEVRILTGVSHSGKSYYANWLSKQNYQHIKFDKIYSYKRHEKGYFNNFLNKVKNMIKNEKVVLDGYCNFLDKHFIQFKKLICNNVIPVVTVSDIKTIMNRRIKLNSPDKVLINIITHYIDRYPQTLDYKNTLVINSTNTNYEELNINSIQDMKKYLKKINLQVFKSYLDTLGYDKFYGDIECINFKGYSDSISSWNNIKKFNIDWKDKKVVELGCFHGYFGFKVEDLGAKEVTGFDCHDKVLNTVPVINWLSNHHVTYRKWKGGDDIPDCDIILCMNVLHHFKEKQELALQKMNCNIAIFEINSNQIDLVNKYFIIKNRISSHRKNRILLLCERIKNG